MGIFSWQRDVQDFRRLQQIIGIIIEHGFHAHAKEAELSHHAPFATHIKRPFIAAAQVTPERVRLLLEALGPTFVKLGQTLSLRSDLVPREYADEFKKLQDRVAPVRFEEIKAVVETEFKRPIGEVFKEFSKEPLASASIAQVHKAVLKDGSVVVIKVQRPGVRETMARDIDIMEYLAKRVDKTRYGVFHAQEIVAEFKRYTARELDFTFEARNLQRFHECFRTHRDVVSPQVHEDFCTGCVLVMEYIDGIPLTDKAQLAKEGYHVGRLADICVRSLVEQAFELGVFHADPHPGNLLAVRKGKHEALAFLDFGIVGFLDDGTKQNMLKLFIAFGNSDAHGVATAALGLAENGPECDHKRVGAVIADRMRGWGGNKLADGKMSLLLYTIIDDLVHEGVRFPADLILLTKAFVTIEGTGMWLAPGVDVGMKLRELTAGLGKRKFSPQQFKADIIRQVQGVQEFAHELPELASVLTQRIRDGRIDVHVDTRELLEVAMIYDLETSKRNIAALGGVFFIGSVLIIALAPAAVFLTLPLYWWGLFCAVMAFLFYLRVRSKIHKYVKPV